MTQRRKSHVKWSSLWNKWMNEWLTYNGEVTKVTWPLGHRLKNMRYTSFRYYCSYNILKFKPAKNEDMALAQLQTSKYVGSRDPPWWPDLRWFFPTKCAKKMPRTQEPGGGGQRGSCPSNFGRNLTLALWRCMDTNGLKSALAPPTFEHFLRYWKMQTKSESLSFASQSVWRWDKRNLWESFSSTLPGTGLIYNVSSCNSAFCVHNIVLNGYYFFPGFAIQKSVSTYSWLGIGYR